MEILSVTGPTRDGTKDILCCALFFSGMLLAYAFIIAHSGEIPMADIRNSAWAELGICRILWRVSLECLILCLPLLLAKSRTGTFLSWTVYVYWGFSLFVCGRYVLCDMSVCSRNVAALSATAMILRLVSYAAMTSAALLRWPSVPACPLPEQRSSDGVLRYGAAAGFLFLISVFLKYGVVPIIHQQIFFA